MNLDGIVPQLVIDVFRERVIVYFSPTEGILAIKLLDMCQGTEHRSSARIVRALDH